MRDLDISKFPPTWRQSVRNPDVCLRSDGYSVVWSREAEGWFALDDHDDTLLEEDGLEGADEEGGFETADEAIAAVDGVFPAADKKHELAPAGARFFGADCRVHVVGDAREAVAVCGALWPAKTLLGGVYDVDTTDSGPLGGKQCRKCAQRVGLRSAL